MPQLTEVVADAPYAVPGLLLATKGTQCVAHVGCRPVLVVVVVVVATVALVSVALVVVVAIAVVASCVSRDE